MSQTARRSIGWGEKKVLRVPPKRRKRLRVGESTTPADRIHAGYPDHVGALH
jgi:hypothetical protein